MNAPRSLRRVIAAALLSGGVAAAGMGLAAPAEAGPSYWHYCPGQKWQYTTPMPPGTDLSVCHWFAATPIPGSTPVRFNLVEIDESQIPPSVLAPQPGFPWP
ncbi:hypothetical protein [Mycobacterium sp. E2989]|uniref:hypothetical protein n=1 Tax=Mycobacterium sp. E2989 TaxID=1834140 RepID=UPI0012E983F5|nr:hypothetical protein [Mycobacterium sp. E2989]